MYKLTLTAEGYNRISFIFEDLLALSNFMMMAMHKAEGEMKAEVTLIAEEGEASEPL